MCNFIRIFQELKGTKAINLFYFQSKNKCQKGEEGIKKKFKKREQQKILRDIRKEERDRTMSNRRNTPVDGVT